MLKLTSISGRNAAALLITAGMLSLTQCRPPSGAVPPDSNHSTGADGRFTLSGSYGSLNYEGNAVRTFGDGNCIVRIPSLRLTFIPDAYVNRTDRINIKSVRLVATKKPPSEGGANASWTILSETEHPLHAELTAESPSITLADIVLTLRAEDVSKADHLGLGITDDSRLWPIRGELK